MDATLKHQWGFIRKFMAGELRPLYYQCFRCGMVQHELDDHACFVIGYIVDQSQWEDTDILDMK